tara:strand:- start:770 stop:1063 length:294 start_codon:yes stop_codon:yes gene_type:complete
MLNSPIDTSIIDAERDALILNHWHDLNTTGLTIFESDEERRYICRDDVIFEVMGSMRSFGLHFDITVAPLEFATRVRKLYDIAINEVMEEAIKDYYL